MSSKLIYYELKVKPKTFIEGISGCLQYQIILIYSLHTPLIFVYLLTSTKAKTKHNVVFTTGNIYKHVFNNTMCKICYEMCSQGKSLTRYGCCCCCGRWNCINVLCFKDMMMIRFSKRPPKKESEILNNNTRSNIKITEHGKNSSTKSVYQWRRSTEYDDNSRESEWGQNACYTWYNIIWEKAMYEEKKKHTSDCLKTYI